MPLEAVWRTGSYKDWVMLEMPKCGCVNIHLSRSMPARGKALNAADQMPLFRSIPRFDQSGPETPPSDRSLSSKTTEIALSASAAGLIPADFQAFCRYAFILGLHLKTCATPVPACTLPVSTSTAAQGLNSPGFEAISSPSGPIALPRSLPTPVCLGFASLQACKCASTRLPLIDAALHRCWGRDCAAMGVCSMRL